MKSKEEKKKSDSESITFRVPAKILNELRQESEKKQVSLNTLTIQIFTEIFSLNQPIHILIVLMIETMLNSFSCSFG